jgi:hypothetical protein
MLCMPPKTSVQANFVFCYMFCVQHGLAARCQDSVGHGVCVWALSSQYQRAVWALHASDGKIRCVQGLIHYLKDWGLMQLVYSVPRTVSCSSCRGGARLLQGGCTCVSGRCANEYIRLVLQQRGPLQQLMHHLSSAASPPLLAASAAAAGCVFSLQVTCCAVGAGTA